MIPGSTENCMIPNLTWKVGPGPFAETDSGQTAFEGLISRNTHTSIIEPHDNDK